jgi:DNA-binding transcriptional regulator PaaX
MITSLDAIAQECGKGITRAKVRTAINKLKKHGILTRESTKESTLIRLTNWQTEQGFFDSDNQCETRDELGNYPTDNQPLTSIEEYKNRIRKKNREYGTELASDWLPSPSLINELSSLRTDLDLKKVFNSFVLFHKAKGTRLKDWDSAFAKWVMDEKKNGPNKKISDMPEFTY